MTEDPEQQAKDRDCSEAKSKRGVCHGCWPRCMSLRGWELFDFSTHREKTRQNPVDFLNWEDGTEGPETPWELEYSGQRNREENFAEKEFILTDFSDELFAAEVLGEGGEDIEINNEKITNVSFSNYKLNYKIYSPVIDGTVSSEFGERVHPINGTLGVHKGIDIALDEGEPIYAIFDGDIIEANYDQWNVNYIKIKE